MSRLTPLLTIGFMIMGIIQWVAVYSFFRVHWDWHWILAFPAAMVAAYTPIIGSVCGMVAAMSVWDWQWWQAGLLFFWQPVLSIAFTGGFSALAWLQDKFRT